MANKIRIKVEAGLLAVSTEFWRTPDAIRKLKPGELIRESQQQPKQVQVSLFSEAPARLH